MKTISAIEIGAGVGGITAAAIHLAKRGPHVTVVEKTPVQVDVVTA